MRRGADEPGPTARDAEAPIAAFDLVLALGGGKVLSHAIRTEEIVIGRDPECAFTIDHSSLSRRHARLRVGTLATIEDLGSTNGTRIAGERLVAGQPTPLRGRAFEIGPFTLVLVERRPGGTARSSQLLEVRDPTTRGLSQLVREFAASDANILILGETGVGKEVLAASLHELSGRPGPFCHVNCAALSEHLLESELFGHERGAFTGAVAQKIGLVEAADGGTLLLDEIGEAPLATQAKLLRVIERREVTRLGSTRSIAVDVRFLAATNRVLAAEVAASRFRADLFFRLDGVTLSIPPLRARPEIILPLALELLAATNQRRGRTSVIEPEALAALTAHPWPGNVRELKAVIERAAVLAGGGDIARRHLTFAATAPGHSDPERPALEPDQQADRARVVQALDQCAGNQSRAAKLLGISRTTMITKLRIYKIRRPSRPRS